MTDLDDYFKLIYKKEYLILISFFFFILTLYFTNETTDTTTLLTSILQSLATLLAIITAFTLFAVQLSSQTYGSRILKMFLNFENNVFFWSLIGLYIISMILCIWVMISIPSNVSNSPISNETNFKISFIVLLSFWCFISIPAFITDTLKRLQPDLIIDNLFIELKQAYKDGSYNIIDYNQYITPLVDIITVSIKNDHIEIAQKGLKYLMEYYEFLKDSKLINQENSKETLNYYLKQYIRIGNVAIDANEEIILTETFKNASELGFDSFQISPDSFNLIMDYYNLFSKKIVEGEFEKPIEEIMNYFEEKYVWILCQNVINNPYDINISNRVMILMDCSNNFWKNTVEKNKLILIENVDNRLDYIIKKLTWSGLFAPINNEIKFLTDFAIVYSEKYPFLFFAVIYKLSTVYLEFNRKGFKPKTDDIQRFNRLFLNIIESFKKIGLKSIKYELHEFELDYRDYTKKCFIYWVIDAVKSIAIKFLEEEVFHQYELEDEIRATIIKSSILTLEEIGLELSKLKSDLAIDVLKSLGKIVNSKNFFLNKQITLNVLDSLEKIYPEMYKSENKGCMVEFTKIITKISSFSVENNINEVISRSRDILNNTIVGIVCNENFENESKIILEELESILNYLLQHNKKDRAEEYILILVEVTDEINENCQKNNLIDSLIKLKENIKDLIKNKKMDDLEEMIDSIKFKSRTRPKVYGKL